jgi:hypothetical protein
MEDFHDCIAEDDVSLAAPCTVKRIQASISKASLTAFYHKYEPTNIPRVNEILEAYSAAELNAALIMKYGAIPSSDVGVQLFRTATSDSATVVSSWTESQVGEFLGNACKLPQYIDEFSESSIDGSMLIDLSDSDLEELGVENKFHRRKILKKIEECGTASQAAVDTRNEAAEAERKAAAAEMENLRRIQEAEKKKTKEDEVQKFNKARRKTHHDNGGKWVKEEMRTRRDPCGRCQACRSGWRDQCKDPWRRTKVPGYWSCCYQNNPTSLCPADDY